MWDEILAEPLPENATLYATTFATAHYARGIAYAAKGLVDEAEIEQVSLRAALTSEVARSDAIISDEGPCILKVGEAMLAGEIEYRKG
ncbi:unnamed protein product, partial [Ascophyllum nodosum]